MSLDIKYLTTNICYLGLATSMLASSLAQAKECLFVASYHKGYEWQDGIEEGIESALIDHCKLHKFYMDTKNNPQTDFAEQQALKVKQTIEQLKPDVVITSDDNAAKYIIQPYYKDSDIPFVFSGINWDGEKYGFPYKNATGMVEVISIAPLLDLIKNVLPSAKNGTFLSGNAKSSKSNFEHYKSHFAKDDIEVAGHFVDTMEAWEKAYLEIQQTNDFMITANKAGISDWDNGRAIAFIKKNGKILSVGHHEFMTHHNTFSMTKVPQEQGEWAAGIAIEILKGTPVSQFPIVANRKWNMYINNGLLESSDPKITLPVSIVRRAIKIDD